MPARPLRDTYRHGNLRAEAVRVAYELATADGAGALSLRRVADSVGVAHRSLYNHFADREALVDAVAEQGFLDLADALRPAQSLADYVRAYVTFALRRPQLYALMKSRPHATMKDRPELQAAVHLSIAEAMRLFGRPDRSKAENRRAVMRVLILLHGGITMHQAGILDVEGDEGLIAELTAMAEAG
ncbi:TetR/AcrR family transcriptional regulator [Phenylobacterium sp.]|uniref:TetR/AcrR family transcriptional regulator n=1 Tax=Phenylobacterium sp. TaxID=1871053 RepID=UPI0025DB5D16|nr:TetR/AcrR family transcriptional regulator [Phenylobacterium sp.]